MIVITSPWTDLAMILMIIANSVMFLVFFLSILKVEHVDKTLSDIAAYTIAVVILVQAISLVVFVFDMTAEAIFFRLEVMTTLLFGTITAASWFLTQPKDGRKRKLD